MSSSIKPPGLPGGAASIAPPATAGAGPLEGPKALGEPNKISYGQAAQAAQSGAAERARGPTVQLLQKLEAGQITRAQAVEALVAQALEARGAGHLDRAQRSELADVLRSALLDDPAVRALLGNSG